MFAAGFVKSVLKHKKGSKCSSSAFSCQSEAQIINCSLSAKNRRIYFSKVYVSCIEPMPYKMTQNGLLLREGHHATNYNAGHISQVASCHWVLVSGCLRSCSGHQCTVN